MTSKLQTLADKFAKVDPGITITDVIHYAGDAEERRETTVVSSGQTLGSLTESGGHWSFEAPADAKFAAVAPIIEVLDEENVKLGGAE